MRRRTRPHHVWLDLIRADVDRLEVCAFGFGRFFHLEEEVAQDDVKIRIPRIQLDGFFNLGLGSVNVPSAGVESDQFQARLIAAGSRSTACINWDSASSSLP
jgi:hypothetical protein